MATHSSVLARRIPATGEPGGLPSLGLHRVWHDWSDLAAAAAGSFSNESQREIRLRSGPVVKNLPANARDKGDESFIPG